MKRDVEIELRNWKNGTNRLPLIVRGARQTGKSYLIEDFGKNNFSDTVVINFELKPALKECFKNLEPLEVINKIELLLGVRIGPNTLLFLDEVQECPQAIISLRYFKEKMPKISVICAGSLLEFALKKEDFKMPVGRVQFLYLEPLSFAEFLDASENQQLRQFLSQVKISDKIDPAVHEKLLELLHLYLLLGGMPAVLSEYFSSKNIMNCQRMQSSLLQTFRADFAKYSSTSQHKYLEKVFDAAPRLSGQRVKYSRIDTETKSRDLKNALNLLSLAGIVRPVLHSKASGLPLGARVDESRFKLNFLDVGLMQNACDLRSEIAMAKDICLINAGQVAEQYVGQELQAYHDKLQPANLYFWSREEKSSSAEVDYIINIGRSIIPIEVKSGSTGRLKSLKLFMNEKGSKLGSRISQEQLSYYDNILSIPLYMIEQMPRLVASIL